MRNRSLHIVLAFQTWNARQNWTTHQYWNSYINILEMEYYRSSTAGIALTKALNTMLENDEITMSDALKILEDFDAEFVKSMRDSYAAQKSLETVEAKGVLNNYSNLDSFWKIDATEVKLIVGKEEIKFDRARFLFMKT